MLLNQQKRCRIINADMRAMLRNTDMTYLMVIIPEYSWKDRNVRWQQDSNVSLFKVLYKDNKVDSNGTSVFKENVNYLRFCTKITK
jgi:hypothetical protein